MTPAEHAALILALPGPTRKLVIDALRVRAMDFVADRLNSDLGDLHADVYRCIFGEDGLPFDPDHYLDPTI